MRKLAALVFGLALIAVPVTAQTSQTVTNFGDVDVDSIDATTATLATAAITTGTITTATCTTLSVTGVASLAGNAMTVGAGFSGGTGTVCISSVIKVGDMYKTTYFIDLTGLASTTDDGDIIGVSTAPAYFGQITDAVNGTIVYAQITCLESPATGADDIDIYGATVGTAKYTDLVTGLTETALNTMGGAWSAAVATPIAFKTALPAANSYLYMCGGEDGTAGTYTAGQFLIELWGK